MSLKRNVDEMITENLPQKGRLNKGIVYSGLHKRPQMEQLVDYLVNGQERVNFPDREAKQIRNHPFMTQLDFFDMQEEQQKAWADTVRKKEAQEVAEKEKTSEALEVARNRNNKAIDVKLGTNEELDQSYRDADYVIDYKDELKTLATRDRRKKDSDAQTKDWGLALEAMGGSYDGPSRSSPRPGDLEEDGEDGRPGSSSAPARRATERRGQNKVGPDGEKLRGQTTLDGFVGRTLKATVVGTTSVAIKVASYSGAGALKLFDYATDADGSRERSRIEREAEAEAAALKKRTSILAELDAGGEARAAIWNAHVDKHALKTYDGPPVAMNENDPDHTAKVWQNVGAMGSDLLAKGERYMLNNPGNAYLEGAGPVRGKKRKRHRYHTFANVFV